MTIKDFIKNGENAKNLVVAAAKKQLIKYGLIAAIPMVILIFLPSIFGGDEMDESDSWDESSYDQYGGDVGNLEDWNGATYESIEFTFPIYRQSDPEWGTKPFGGSSSGKTIGSSGCGGTSLAMIVSGFTGHAHTPWDVVQVLDEKMPGEYYIPRSGSSHRIFWDSRIINYYHCDSTLIGERICLHPDSDKPEDYSNTDFSSTERAFSNGKCVVFSLTRTDKTQHLIAAVPASQADKERGYMFCVLDPSTQLDGLYENANELYTHPHGPRQLYSLKAVAAIGKGTNEPRRDEDTSRTYTGDLYNEDGTVNEEKIAELGTWLEQTYHLISAGTSFAEAYSNRRACEAVTGRYLGFRGWCSENKPDSKLASGCLHVYQCPWWSQGRASEVENTKVLIGGDGGAIYSNAVNKNASDGRIYQTGHIAKPGAIVSYVSSDSTTGHTAYVEAVDGVNQCYYISHSGGGKKWYGVQKVHGLNNAPDGWTGWRVTGFVYVKETIEEERRGSERPPELEE